MTYILQKTKIKKLLFVWNWFMVVTPCFYFICSDYYFSWLTWVTDERVCLQWLKRVQNVSVLSICDFREDWQTWDCPKVRYIKITDTYFWRSRHNNGDSSTANILCCKARITAFNYQLLCKKALSIHGSIFLLNK